MKDNAMTIREQILAGTLVPDYTHERFAPPPPPSPVPAFKGREIRYAPPPAMPEIDVLIANTLESAIHGQKVFDLLEHTRRAAVLFAARRAKGNQTRASEMLGVGRMTLRAWCNRFRIDPAFYNTRAVHKEVA